MKQILAIIKYTLQQNIRNRIYYVLLIFAVILVFVSMLLSVLGGEQPTRILLDFGLPTIEFIALLVMVFCGISLVFEETDSKSIYLILVRPIPKWYYIVGRYLGLLLSVAISMILMYVFHLIMLFYKGWQFDFSYLVAVFSSIIKIAIVGSLSIFFSLFSTSATSSLVFIFFIWLLGHFSAEMKFLVDKIELAPIRIIMKLIYFIVPNLQYFNWKDFMDSQMVFFDWFPVAFVYGAVYSFAFICLGILTFNKKEF